MRRALSFAFVAIALGLACSSRREGGAPASPDAAPDALDAAAPAVLPPFMTRASILVSGHDRPTAGDCRADLCRHNENTDLIAWSGALWLVHRTANSQSLGPNSALHVYRSTDGGSTFAETSRIEAPSDRDIRDPHFYVVGDALHIEALTRFPVLKARDTDVDTVAVNLHSQDGVTWSAPQPIGPHGWSFWRIKQSAGTYYSAAYQDGDRSVVLYSSTDGLTWTAGATIYDVSADTPLETELTFLPSGRLLALVRTDGTDAELLGDDGRLRTQVCWSTPPYATFDCNAVLDGQRLDGPVSFFVGARLFVIARKHLQGTGRKRTALFELTGTLEGGPIAIVDKGELPSAGDTSYAGIAFPNAPASSTTSAPSPADERNAVVSWYSGDLAQDEAWVLAMFDLTDIWLGQIDFTRL